MIFNDIKFPIEGILREPLLLIEWLIVLLFLEMSIVFIAKVMKREKKERNQQEIAYIMLFLGFSLMWVFIILSDFYAEILIARRFFKGIAYLIMLYCQFQFFYRMEKDQIFLKKFLFTKCYIVLLIILAIVFFVNIDLNITEIIGYLFYMIISTLFWIAYLKQFVTNTYIRNTQKNLSLVVLILSIGFFFTGIGYLLTMDFIIYRYGLEIRLIGNFIQLIGFCFTFLFFYFVPPLSEYSWKNKLDRLFLMLKSGICIYYKFFKEEDDIIEEQSISGAIKSINDVLNEITDKKGISIIKRKHKMFIIQPSTFTTGVLICDEELHSLKLLLSRFLERIEIDYGKIIEDWNLEMKVFDPIENLAKEFFLFK